MTDHATSHTNQLPAARPGDLALCPIRVGDRITATRDPAVRGQVTYVSDYPDGVIECLVELPDGQKFFAPPWMLRPADGDQDAFTAQVEALVAAQRVTAARVLDGKRQRVVTIARQAAQTLATLIDDLEHDRIPSELEFGDEFTDLEDLLHEAGEFQSDAIALNLLDPPQPDNADTP